MIKQNNGCRRQSKLLPSKANPRARHGLMLLLLLFMSENVALAQPVGCLETIQRSESYETVNGVIEWWDGFYDDEQHEVLYKYDKTEKEKAIWGF